MGWLVTAIAQRLAEFVVLSAIEFAWAIASPPDAFSRAPHTFAEWKGDLLAIFFEVGFFFVIFLFGPLAILAQALVLRLKQPRLFSLVPCLLFVCEAVLITALWPLHLRYPEWIAVACGTLGIFLVDRFVARVRAGAAVL